mmetsp:Transcript_42316/g.99274  ORF Transcript_42316/g.99274 Transcript_42316/m.99274 type:complete len:578 (-) Transcript_42316:522-2255(-)
MLAATQLDGRVALGGKPGHGLSVQLQLDDAVVAWRPHEVDKRMARQGIEQGQGLGELQRTVARAGGQCGDGQRQHGEPTLMARRCGAVNAFHRSLHRRVAGLEIVVGTVQRADARLHRPGADLVVDRDEEVFIPDAQQGFANLGIALGGVRLGLDLLDQCIQLGVTELAEVEIAIRAGRSGMGEGLQSQLGVIGWCAPTQHVERRLVALEGLAVRDERRRDQPCLHADLGPHAHGCLTDRLVVDIAVVRAMQREFEALRVAGLGQKPAGLVRVSFRGRVECSLPAIGARWHHQRPGDRQAAHDAALDRLAVQGQVHGLAHALVFEGVPALDVGVAQLVAALVHHKEDGPDLRALDDLELARLLDPEEICRRQVGDQVHVTGEEGGHAGRSRLDRQVGQLGDVAAVAAPPVFVLLQLELLIGLPGQEAIRAGACGIAAREVLVLGLVVGDAARVVLQAPCLAHDEEIGDVLQQHRRGRFQHQVDRVGVDLADLLDARHVDLHGAQRLADTVKAEQHIVRRERRTVMELDATAQLEAHLGGRQIGPLGGQSRLGLVALVAPRQALVDVVADRDGGGVVL